MKKKGSVLAGDVGGTRTVLSLFKESKHGLEELREETFSNRDRESIDEILKEFLGKETTPPQAICLGVAGTVNDGKSKVTNLPWELDESALARSTGVPRVKLLNDLEASAYGMLDLGEEELCILNRGAEPAGKGNIAVIAAGTGLGEAILYWDGEQHQVVVSEGGHADFAPRTDEEIGLLKYLRKKYGGHVSYERVLSSPGVFDIYCFLRDTSFAEETDWMAARLKTGDPSAVVTKAGLEEGEPLSIRSLAMFASLFGAEAGNLALRCLAVGGVYLGGGIAPQILSILNDGHFLEGFTNKGRFSDVVGSMPVSVALNPRTALLGAASYALRV